MYYVRVVAGVLFGILVFGLLDYTLPSQNTLRISNTYNRLTEIPPSAAIFWASDSTGTVENAQGQRDVRFIDAVRPGGRRLRLSQRGYGLGLAALFQVRQREPAGRGHEPAILGA